MRMCFDVTSTPALYRIEEELRALGYRDWHVHVRDDVQDHDIAWIDRNYEVTLDIDDDARGVQMIEAIAAIESIFGQRL